MTTTNTTRRKRFRNIAGPAIRRFRNTKGWTQAEFAAKLQLSGLDFDRAGVAKLESQLRSLFDFELFIVAAVLGVSADKLSPGVRKTKNDLPMLQEGHRATS